MTVIHTPSNQTTDPGLSFTGNDQILAIAPGVLISSDQNVGVFGGTFNDLDLLNYGTIVSTGAAGAGFSGNGIVALNGVGGLVSGVAGFAFLGTDGAFVTNEGTINGFFAGVSFEGGSDVLLANTGTITAAIAGVSVGVTAGLSEIVNDGVISALGAGIVVATAAGVTTVIENDGVITGGTAEGEGAAIVSTSGSVSLFNYGEIEGGTKLAGDAADFVANYGEIWGDISLGGGNDVYNGADGIQLFVFGEGGDDALFGGFMDEVLDGGDGNDVLDGGVGNDLLIGGAGADEFVFSTAPNSKTNRDTIADFSTTEGDKILLDRDVFTHLGKEGVLRAKYFDIGKKPENKNDRIVYNENKGVLIYAEKGSKTDKADRIKFANVDPGLDLDNADFLLF